VFLSSTLTMTAVLGGLAGGDAICQRLADAKKLGATWKAWLSDATASPSTRFTQAAVPYRLMSGTLVANDWTSLTSGVLAHAIDMDEAGTTVLPDSSVTEVWTGTTPSGTYAGASCQDWTSSQAHGVMCALICGEVGLFDRTNAEWTAVYLQFCDRGDLRLYCFEQ